MNGHQTWQVVLILTLGAAFAICVVGSAITGLLAAFHRQPVVRTGWFLKSGILHMWPKDDFTDAGLNYRRACLRCYACALICFLLAAMTMWVLS